MLRSLGASMHAIHSSKGKHININKMPRQKVGCLLHLHYELLFLTLFKAHFLFGKKEKLLRREGGIAPESGSMIDVFVHCILPAVHSASNIICP